MGSGKCMYLPSLKSTQTGDTLATMDTKGRAGQDSSGRVESARMSIGICQLAQVMDSTRA